MVAALALVLAACGGDDGDDERTEGSSTSSRSSSTTTSTTSVGSSSTTGAGVTTTTTTAASAGSCGAQYPAIEAAIKGSDVAGLSSQAANLTVVNCRLAPSNPIWAAAEAAPNPGTSLQGGTVVLQRIGALWTVEAVGTDQVGCDAPAPVPTELDLPC